MITYICQNCGHLLHEAACGWPGCHCVSPSVRITPCEAEVLKLLAQGKTTKEIGTKLFVSTKTVEVHKYNLMRKLKISSRVLLAAVALRAGLLTLDDFNAPIIALKITPEAKP